MLDDASCETVGAGGKVSDGEGDKVRAIGDDKEK
jgi:hypothetical protein